jgi:hypothetical protein
VIDRHAPDVMAVEDIFYGKNVRTTVMLGHTRGAVLLAGALRDLEVADYSPAEVKNAIVGTGRATKEQVQFMVTKLLRLKSAPTPSDAADGVAVALCHLNTGRLPWPVTSGGGGSMISRVRGTLLRRDPDSVEIMTAGGVGYELFDPPVGVREAAARTRRWSC